MTALRIPDRWSEVTAEWMTAALAGRFPGAEVAAVTLRWASDGTNRRARFGLRYSRGAGPEVVFIKAEGAHREVHARNGNLFNEPRIYASGMPLPLDHPQPYGVLIDEAALDWMVVMEDVSLRGGDPRDSTRPLSAGQVGNGIRGLARLHRAYWGFTAATHPALAWVQTWAPTEGFHSALRRRIPLALQRADGRLPTEVARLSAEEIVDLWVRYVALLDRDPTLLHADAHIGNVYLLPGDDVGFLDWQVVRRGHCPRTSATSCKARWSPPTGGPPSGSSSPPTPRRSAAGSARRTRGGGTVARRPTGWPSGYRRWGPTVTSRRTSHWSSPSVTPWHSWNCGPRTR